MASSKIEILYLLKFGKNECRLNNVYNALFFQPYLRFDDIFYTNLSVEQTVDIV